MGSMNRKVVVITGGTRGLGKAMAALLAAEGAAVVVTSRKAKFSARKPGFREVCVAPLDVADENSVRKLFAWVSSKLGKLDVLVNNAGVGVFKPVTKLSLADWRATLDTNLTGVFLCSREAFALMKEQGGGRILNVGSVADYVPLAGNAAYGASKSGVRALSRILNEEGKSCGIRVSHLSVGATFTEIWKGREGFDAGDMLAPSDVAEAVLDIARRPLRVRIDEVRIVPPKGVL